MGKRSRDKGKEGERNVGRLFLRQGYLAWRTGQNRQSKLDTESDDVSASMTPEHMRCDSDGTENRYGEHIDLYYVDQERHPNKGESVVPISELTPIPNLTIEVKNGYDTKSYNKPIRNWIKKTKRQTPEGNIWSIFWRKDYAPKFCYRLIYERNGVIVMTINKKQTLNAIDELCDLAQKERDESTLEYGAPMFEK